MKIKAKAIRVLIDISFILLIAFIISALISSTGSIVSVLLSGVLCSSLASLIILFVEYTQEKINAIEKLYCESERIKKQIQKSIYFLPPDKFNIEDPEKIKKFVDGYLAIIDIDLTDLGFLYADICFLSEFSPRLEQCKKRHWIYENIYNSFRNYKSCIANEKRHLDAIVDGGYKKIHPATYELFTKMQGSFFTTTEQDLINVVEANYLKKIETNNNKLLEMIHSEKQPLQESYVINVNFEI